MDIDRRAVDVIDLWTGTVEQTDPVCSTVLAGLAMPLARIFG